ncbi:hypothetical protein Zm00014a_040124 [Zea mays]|uniref:Uncharacterized protein n=1 Tax=Zea mays TaxID=4577 RepID=A0A3L6DIL9_MAIZE|nr:hypothetical protein Zm00014a_040124 [Zea mays]
MDRQQGRAPRTHHLPLAAGRAAGKPRRRTSGFFVTIWIATVMFKSNDILCKQTALKRERKITVLVGITILFVVHVSGFYWCYKNGDLIRPLMMLPPKEIPPFWHAIFIILVNAGISILSTGLRYNGAPNCYGCQMFTLLMYYKNNIGRSYRRQVNHLHLLSYIFCEIFWRISSITHGSNVDDCGIFSTFVLCIIAYTCVVPFFPEQGVWKPIFVSNHWLVSHFQVDICCGKGAIRSLI